MRAVFIARLLALAFVFLLAAPCCSVLIARSRCESCNELPLNPAASDTATVEWQTPPDSFSRMGSATEEGGALAGILENSQLCSEFEEICLLVPTSDLRHPDETPAGTIIVYGYWFYEDQFLHAKPARYATVRLWDDGQVDTLLATTYVQSDGYYEFPPIANDEGPQENGYDLYVKLACDSLQYNIIRVGWGTLVPAAFSTEISYNATSGIYDMGSLVVTGARTECWGVYDNTVDGYFWLLNEVGWSRSKVYAVANNPSPGSYSTGDGMYFYLGDGWDRSTVLHEWAHCVQFEARGGSFPPKNGADSHWPDSEFDEGWALCEGWAEFFECAVDNDPSVVYGDNVYGTLESTVYADSPFGHGDYGDWDGDAVEGAVASVFWDIFDGVDAGDYPGFDRDGYGDVIDCEFAKLWEIFLNTDPNSIHEFWAEWSPRDVGLWAVFRHARIVVSEPRNIAVTGVQLSGLRVAVGEIVRLDITVMNQGVFPENFTVKAFAGDFLIDSLANSSIEASANAGISLFWNTTGFTAGDYTVSVRAMAFPADLNATDDVNAENIVTVFEPIILSPGHDICINSIATSKSIVGQGYPLYIEVRAWNFGSFPETFNITVSANSTTIIRFSDVSLASGDFATITFMWSATGFAYGNCTISAYASPVENETDIADNTLSGGTVYVGIPGDINGDGVVDVYDLIVIASAYGFSPSDPNWNSDSDINGDNTIDIFDLILGASHYGETTS